MKTKQFVNLNLGDFEAFDYSTDPTADPSDAPWISQVRPGLQFFAVEILFENTGAERLDARSQPARKNLSREICINGWCGTTDNVSMTGCGQWEIVTVDRSHGNGRYDITAQRIQ